MKIALCGYLGSGCTEVAQILASKFGLETVNTSSIFAAIKNFESLSGSGEIDMDKIIKEKLEEILKGDNVIVEGRSAFMLLNRRDMIKIFLNAPLGDRIKHVADRRGVPVEGAREDVERSDRERNHLIQRFFNKDRADATDFDFSIKTSSKAFSKIADTIAEVIKSVFL